jgi:hypothetical protein
MNPMAVLCLETYEANTINTAKNTAAIYCPSAEHVSYVVVASSASSPVGTTLIIQGSNDGTNFTGLSTAVTVTGNGVFTANLSAASVAYLYYRLAYARSSGSYVATTSVCAKGSNI